MCSVNNNNNSSCVVECVHKHVVVRTCEDLHGVVVMMGTKIEHISFMLFSRR